MKNLKIKLALLFGRAVGIDADEYETSPYEGDDSFIWAYHALVEYKGHMMPTPIILRMGGIMGAVLRWRVNRVKIVGTRGVDWFFTCKCGEYVFYSPNSRECSENDHHQLPKEPVWYDTWVINGNLATLAILNDISPQISVAFGGGKGDILYSNGNVAIWNGESHIIAPVELAAEVYQLKLVNEEFKTLQVLQEFDDLV